MAASDILRETRKWRQYVEANLGGGGAGSPYPANDFIQWSPTTGDDLDFLAYLENYDPLFASVSLIAEFEGLNGATSYTAETGQVLTVGASGAALRTNPQPTELHGNSALDYPTSGSFSAYFPDAANLELGTNPFCIEITMRKENDSSNGVYILVSKWNFSTNNRSYLLNFNTTTNTLTWAGSTDGINGTNILQNVMDLLDNVVYDIAIDFDGTTHRMFIDGVLVQSNVTGFSYFSGTADFGVGGYATAVAADAFDGQLDHLRVTLASRYTANYTPSRERFPLSLTDDEYFVGGDKDYPTEVRGLDVSLFYGTAQVARTTTLSGGGLEVNNEATGAGFERVLTTSDLALVSPGGVDTNVQFNNAGVLDGAANLTWDDANNLLTLDGVLYLSEEVAGADVANFGQLFVNTGQRLTFRDENGDLISLGPQRIRFDDQFGEQHTWDLNVGGGAAMTFTSTNIVDTQFPVAISAIAAGSGDRFFIQHNTNLVTMDSTGSAPVLRLDFDRVDMFQGNILRFLEVGGLEPCDMQNNGNYLDVNLNAGTRGFRLRGSSSLYMAEQAAANTDQATYGQIYVDSADDGLYYKYDSVTAVRLDTGGASIPASTDEFRILVATNAGTWRESGTSVEIQDNLTGSSAQFRGISSSLNSPSQGVFSARPISLGANCIPLESYAGATNYFYILHDLSPSGGNETLEFHFRDSSGAQNAWIEFEGSGELWFKNRTLRMSQNGSFYVAEQAAAQGDLGGFGQFWWRTDGTPMGTNDAGTDYELNLGGAPASTLALAADNSDTAVSTTVVTNDANLTGFSLDANQTYEFEAYIRFSVAAGSGGARWDFNVSGGALEYGVYSWFGIANDGPRVDEDSRDKVALSDEQTITVTAGASVGIRIRGTVRPSANATIDFQFAQNVSDVNAVTRQRGSWIRFTPINSV